MNAIPPNLSCPCESGINYEDCCGRTVPVPDKVIAVSDGEGPATKALTPQLQAAIESTSTIPDFFPISINFAQDKVLYTKMSPRWFQESVFLDPARILGRLKFESNLKWLQEQTEIITWQPTSFIFHTAFCGSTLMSQALGVIFDSLALREPDVLNNLLFYKNSHVEKNPDIDAWGDRIMRLLSRRYYPSQGVVVKANDYANPIMLDLIHWHSDLAMLFMYTPLSEFVAGCLKANNRRTWIRQRYQAVYAKIQKCLNLPATFQLHEDAFARMAAVYWCYNIALFLEVWQQTPQKIRSLDFNTMLENPLKSIIACGNFFGLKTDKAKTDLQQIINPLFGVHSKNSAFAYSPQQRQQDVAKIRQTHQAQFAAAEQLAHQILAENYPVSGLPANLMD